MASRYRVTADWDAEAGVWVSTSDVPGLVIETATLAEFEAVMRDLVPELLAENCGVEGPVSIEWTSHGAFELAAA